MNEIRAYTPALWAKHEKSVRQSLEAYKERGFCTSFGDLRREIYAVAAPMRLLAERCQRLAQCQQIPVAPALERAVRGRSVRFAKAGAMEQKPEECE